MKGQAEARGDRLSPSAIMVMRDAAGTITRAPGSPNPA